MPKLLNNSMTCSALLCLFVSYNKLILANPDAALVAHYVDIMAGKREIDLSRSELSLVEMEALAEALKSNTTVKHLDISNNNLDNSQIQVLTQALRENKYLRSIDISDNLIFDTGAYYLVDFLKTSSSVIYINMSGNNFSFLYANEIVAGLQKNRRNRA